VIRRIFGLETEFGVTCAAPEGRGLSAEEVARYLFRKVVAWGRSSNVFLANGSRLYLDVGSHPEYATAECDDLAQLVAHDKAGERILHELAVDAQARLDADGVVGTIHLFKNNLDSAGNSYGCHENYLIRRRADFARTADVLVPFLITRQILTGSGHVLVTSRGPIYTFSQRADHLWEATSSATTRSRPIINTRDEPHADAEEYRRLHVISGDSSMSQTTTMLKVGMTDLMLRMLEAGVTFRDFTLENPVRAIREISHDLTGSAQVPLARGTKMSALAMQTAYFERARTFVDAAEHRGPHDEQVLDLWQRGLEALGSDDLTGVETELDWVIKKRLIDRYRAAHEVPLSDARIRRLDLAYHDISPTDGLFARLVERGLAATVVDEAAIAQAVEEPPQTTRARLRGEFVRAATARRRDFTVDWVHLKINDQAGRTVLCKDPFRSIDPRVDRLIASLDPGEAGSVLASDPVPGP
jgi:proteasome accessory factor A